MAARVALRPMTPEERQGGPRRVARLAHRTAPHRTAPIRLVERVRIVQAAAQGRAVGRCAPAVAAALGCSRPTAYAWARRFNEQGPAGLPGAAAKGASSAPSARPPARP